MDKDIQYNQQNIIKPQINWLVTLLLAGIIGLAAGLGVFFWQQQQIATLHTQLAGASRTPTDDEQVIAASKAFCEANVPEVGYKIVFKPGIVKGKEILYSSDKQFAYINIGCNAVEQESKEEGLYGKAYYLKRVNGIWVVLAQSTQELELSLRQQFGIPTDFN